MPSAWERRRDGLMYPHTASDLGTLAAYRAGGAMEMYVARNHYMYDQPIGTLLAGLLAFLVLFVCCFFAWKAIEWMRNRGEDHAAEDQDLYSTGPQDPWHRERSNWSADPDREDEEFLLTFGSPEEREAIKKRRRSRNQNE